MMHRVLRCGVVIAVVAPITVAACTDTDSATSLNPEGPPMLRQVRLVERYADSRSRTVFAFGTHPLAPEEEINNNVQAASASGNKLRLIIDELLVGNNLEEIQCRGPVDDDLYGRVPLGATPDDIARCSVADDVLPASCNRKNPRSVCLCANPAGCIRGVTTVPEGDPVGVQDINQDGATDDTRMIAGAVGIECGAITVPINLDLSYWNPSGDQNKPAMGGFDALGPAIVITPAGALPTNLACKLTVAPEVVDKQGIQVCAPAGGEIAAGCTPGDLDAFSFKVEPLTIAAGAPRDNETGVSKTDPLTFAPNAPVDAASLSAIQISPTVTFTATTPMPNMIRIDVPGGLAPTTMYTVTFPATVRDAYAQPLAAPVVFHFTTGA